MDANITALHTCRHPCHRAQHNCIAAIYVPLLTCRKGTMMCNDNDLTSYRVYFCIPGVLIRRLFSRNSPRTKKCMMSAEPVQVLDVAAWGDALSK